MSVMCTICMDFLTERPQELSNGEDFIMCALTCGHLFHQTCIKRWFNGQGARPNGYGECVTCKTRSQLSRALRIYPSGDEESNDRVEENKNMKALIEDNQKLEAKLRDVMKELSDLRVVYDEESHEFESLKMEHAQVLSTVDAQQDQIRENNEITRALENSVKTALEQKDKEKQEAFDLLAMARLQIKCSGD